jgi:hypothetical protein
VFGTFSDESVERGIEIITAFINGDEGMAHEIAGQTKDPVMAATMGKLAAQIILNYENASDPSAGIELWRRTLLAIAAARL